MEINFAWWHCHYNILMYIYIMIYRRTSMSRTIYKTFCVLLAVCFASATVLPSQVFAQSQLLLPSPGSMVTASSAYIPPMIKGLQVFPNEPLRFDFVIDTGDSEFSEDEFEEEASQLIKYFMASLTVPEDELWVNLSPYENHRIIPQAFGLTDMGQNLLKQDYILKQLTASLIYPEEDLGSEFWERVYEKAQKDYNIEDIPVNTFNKVWIVPDKAVVYVNGTTAFISESRLKVLLDQDYIALKENIGNDAFGMDQIEGSDIDNVSEIASEMIRELILPEIEKEVNEGENFSTLRQIYHSMILSTWFKRNLMRSFVGQVYAGKNKVIGVDNDDKQAKDKIYQKYLKAFEVGVFNYIKEEYDPISQEIVPRKYFSGGTIFGFEGTNTAALVEFDATPMDISAVADNSMVGEYKKVSSRWDAVSETNRNADYSNDSSGAPPGFDDGIGDFWKDESKDSSMLRLDRARKSIRVLFHLIAFVVSSLVVNDTVTAAEIYQAWNTESGAQRWIVKTEKGDTVETIIKQILEVRRNRVDPKFASRMAERILSDNRVIIGNNPLKPGQILDATNTYNLLSEFSLLRNADVIVMYALDVEGREVKFYFFVTEDGFDCVGITINSDSIFLNLANFKRHTDAIVEKGSYDRTLAPGRGEFFDKIYAGRSAESIYSSWLWEAMIHEMIHTITTGYIEQGKLREGAQEKIDLNTLPEGVILNPIKYSEEISAFLGQIAHSKDPKYILNLMNTVAVLTPDATPGGIEYKYTGQFITGTVLKELGFLDFYVEKYIEDSGARTDAEKLNVKSTIISQYVNGFPKFDLQAYSYFQDFVEGLENKNINDMAGKVFERYFGKLPDFSKVAIHETVKKFVKEKYYPDKESNAEKISGSIEAVGEPSAATITGDDIITFPVKTTSPGASISVSFEPPRMEDIEIAHKFFMRQFSSPDFGYSRNELKAISKYILTKYTFSGDEGRYDEKFQEEHQKKVEKEEKRLITAIKTGGNFSPQSILKWAEDTFEFHLDNVTSREVVEQLTPANNVMKVFSAEVEPETSMEALLQRVDDFTEWQIKINFVKDKDGRFYWLDSGGRRVGINVGEHVRFNLEGMETEFNDRDNEATELKVTVSQDGIVSFEWVNPPVISETPFSRTRPEHELYISYSKDPAHVYQSGIYFNLRQNLTKYFLDLNIKEQETIVISYEKVLYKMDMDSKDPHHVNYVKKIIPTLGLEFHDFSIRCAEEGIEVTKMKPGQGLFPFQFDWKEQADPNNAAQGENAPDKVGGIDLNPVLLQLEEQGQQINFSKPGFDPEIFNNIQIQGLSPVIINIQPITNMLLLFGTNRQSQDDNIS